MLLLIQKYGRLCNQLFYFSNLIAYAIEHHVTLYNAPFYEYRQYFSATAINKFGPYNIKVLSKWYYPFLNKIGYLLFKVAKSSPFHNFAKVSGDLKWSIENHSKSQILIPYGWPFIDNELFIRHGDIIRSFFAPVEPFRSNIRNVISNCRNNVDILIGIHIRRGDYKKWRGGIYYFNDEDYEMIMKQVSRQFDKSVGFLLCSDEKINLDSFKNLKCFFGGEHFVEDLYLLAECDYIIGPPSTFSLWASFYGEKPYLHIEDRNSAIDINDFRICRGLLSEDHLGKEQPKASNCH